MPVITTKSTKAEILKAYEEANRKIESDINQVFEFCDMGCDDLARVHIKKFPGYRPMFISKGTPYGVGGPQLNYCPFCGRKYEDA